MEGVLAEALLQQHMEGMLAKRLTLAPASAQ
jgi:hypothetical protein